MRYLIIIVVSSFLVYSITLSEEKMGSCEKYAEIVCTICGSEHPACSEFKTKMKLHPEDEQCVKAVTHLPSLYEKGSETQRALLKKVICTGKTQQQGPPISH